MTGVENLGLFIATGILLNLTPGPDVLCILNHSLKGDWRVGAVAALGITGGCFVHVTAAALGLGAMLATSATAFSVLKWLGAAYLFYVGWTMLGLVKSKDATNSIASRAITTMVTGQDCFKNVFMNGFWTNLLNPKVALFFLAFLPQFIAPDAPHKTLAFLLLGLLFNFNSLLVGLGYAVVGAALSRRFIVLQRSMRWFQRMAGAFFIGFGLKLALSPTD